MDETPFLYFSTNPSNPYYIHPNENLTLILVTPTLDNKNYLSWTHSMKVALISRNKVRFIDNTFLKPSTNNPLNDPWIRCSKLGLSWLQRSFLDSITQSILWFDNAFLVWENLRNRFSEGDIFRLSDLQDDLIRLQQVLLTSPTITLNWHPSGNKSIHTDQSNPIHMLYHALVVSFLICGNFATKTEFSNF